MTEHMSPAPGVPQTDAKAKAGAVIAAVGLIATTLVAALPNNDQVQLWGALVVGLATVAGTYLGTYHTQNKIKAAAVKPAKHGNDWEGKPRPRNEAGQYGGPINLIIGVLVIVLLVVLILALAR